MRSISAGQAYLSALEAPDLVLLGQEGKERVEHDVDEVERAVDGEVRHVTNSHRDILSVRLGTQASDH